MTYREAGRGAQARVLRGPRRAATAIVTVVLGCGAILPTALAQEFLAKENDELRNVLARDPGGHWTPGELLRAEPVPLPQPAEDKDTFLQKARGDTLATIEATGRVRATAEREATGGNVQADGIDVSDPAEVAPDPTDRLFPASALEMRRVERSATQPPETAPSPAQRTQVGAGPQGGNSAGSEGQPVGDIDRPDIFQPSDVGTSGAYFSSSRLVPTDARLAYPYRAAGKLFFEKPGGGSFICSAAVIKPRLVLTAGHCVHQGSGGSNGFYARFLFVPAYHQGLAPYQAWNWTWVITTPQWSTSNGVVPNAADFAILEVEDRRFGTEVKRIGDVTGWFGYRVNALMPNHTKKIGYPGNFDSGEIMHQVDSQHHLAAAPNTVLYGSDMGGGSSGGPWIENFGVRAVGQTGGLQPVPNRIVGVTSYGYVSVDPKVQGSSILNQDFINLLNTACAHKAGNC